MSEFGLEIHDDAWFDSDAKRQMAGSWPFEEPCICPDAEGWTYSRILRFFERDGKIVFRLPSSTAWLVFSDLKHFSRYTRFLVKHPSFFVR